MECIVEYVSEIIASIQSYGPESKFDMMPIVEYSGYYVEEKTVQSCRVDLVVADGEWSRGPKRDRSRGVTRDGEEEVLRVSADCKGE